VDLNWFLLGSELFKAVFHSLFFCEFNGGCRFNSSTNLISAIDATMLLALVEAMRHTARFIRLKSYLNRFM
jgi:hypothetical protein